MWWAGAVGAWRAGALACGRYMHWVLVGWVTGGWVVRWAGALATDTWCAGAQRAGWPGALGTLWVGALVGGGWAHRVCGWQGQDVCWLLPLGV